jgi:hypothetical protein
MKARFIWLCIGLAFAVTLAIVIGQRLSAEAMSVMVGVVAGVAASIPTSLIVVWFATRTLSITRSTSAAAPLQPEPRVVVVPQAMAAGYQNFAGYGAPAYGAPANLAMQIPAPQAFAPRQFNVIGGSEAGAPEFEPRQEVIWPQ